MKKIECIIRSEKLKMLSDNLLLAGVGGMTVSEVKGFGSQTTRPPNYLFLPKTKIEIYCADEQLEEIVSCIVKACKEETIGSGKIVVIPIEDCIRIRTNEKGEKGIL
ncbi:MAG: P-II family nitrogen regulator [Candidatus Omnitrophica bacterium]|nr:P-II family nitrogen regulator [Candidatus Omnitrophota bacterium]MCK5289108.1 P-II family nitrogen regulator [Candidatus Omnitrophota bacterium]